MLLTDFHGEHEQFVLRDGKLVSTRKREGTGLYSVDSGVYADAGGDVSFPLLRNLHENVERNRNTDRVGHVGGRSCCNIQTACLDWGAAVRQHESNDESTDSELGTFDLVVWCVMYIKMCSVSLHYT